MRADRADASFGPLSTGQLAAIAVLVALAGVWRARKAAATPRERAGTPKASAPKDRGAGGPGPRSRS